MSPAKVGVIGCGIAGPVLATFLKIKGYDPVLYERYESTADAGLVLGIQRNGLLVLAKIPGLIEHIDGRRIEEVHFYSTVEEDKGLLGISDQPRQSAVNDGLGMVVAPRARLQRKLATFAENAGVPIKWGHKLESLEQREDGVAVTFANGVTATLDFIVGCDGLRSQTRSCLFGERPAEYTGLSGQGALLFWIGSESPHVAHDMYGHGAHALLIPVSKSEMMWAVTQSEPESRETWKAIDCTAAEEFKQSSFSHWDFGAGEVIKASTKIVKYGIYLRPELPAWHKGRVVLVGDAAHPISPHVGQGANQALEDIDLLVELLEKYNPSVGAPDLSTLTKIFSELYEARAPRITDMIKRAKVQAETRVTYGVEACIARNNVYRETCKNGTIAKARLGA